MRHVWLLGILSIGLFAANVVQVGDKYKDSGKCKACHSHIVAQWEDSWHAKSHYGNDEYFR
jgi:hypothetical protein